MSDKEQRRRSSNPTYVRVGFVVFAGVMLMLLGGFQAIEGLVALFNDGYYLTAPNGLLIDTGFTV